MIKNKWYEKEDYWAIIVGLGLISVLSISFFYGGMDLFKSMAVNFPSWEMNQLGKILHVLVENKLVGIIYLFVLFSIVFGIASRFLGYSIRSYLAGFSIIFLLSLLIQFLSANKMMKEWQLESAFLALLIGLFIGNCTRLPKFFHSALRTEFYVKTGIVLMGATLPFTLIMKAGPMAILQAMIVSVVTFATIYFAATKLFGLDPKFGSTLGAGGSICGVSAAIAIGSACRAKKEHVSVAVTLVIGWAVAMIFILPMLVKYFEMQAGPAGAWIGTSEFADAAGFAAAAAIGDEQAIKSFTLMKVIGRDIFVGVWALLVAFLSVTVWERRDRAVVDKVDKGQIWSRFPKFVLGFFCASIIITLILLSLDAATGSRFSKDVLGCIKNFRGWAFTWTFLCIGLTTRFKELSEIGWKPFWAFTIGVIINVPLGYFLSNVVFVDFWNSLK